MMIKIEIEDDDICCEGCGFGIDFEQDEYVVRHTRRVERIFCSEDCADEFEFDYYPPDPEDDLWDRWGCDFRDPDGRSALRDGSRIYPCPNCGEPNMLSPKDVQLGYQCDHCADMLERGYP